MADKKDRKGGQKIELPIFLTTNRRHRLKILLEDCMSKFRHSSEICSSSDS